MHCVVTLSSKLIETMFDEIMLCCTRVKWLSQFAKRFNSRFHGGTCISSHRSSNNSCILTFGALTFILAIVKEESIPLYMIQVFFAVYINSNNYYPSYPVQFEK